MNWLWWTVIKLRDVERYYYIYDDWILWFYYNFLLRQTRTISAVICRWNLRVFVLGSIRRHSMSEQASKPASEPVCLPDTRRIHCIYYAYLSVCLQCMHAALTASVVEPWLVGLCCQRQPQQHSFITDTEARNSILMYHSAAAAAIALIVWNNYSIDETEKYYPLTVV